MTVLQILGAMLRRLITISLIINGFLPRKRIGELLQIPLGHILRHAVILGPTGFWQMERTKQLINPRKVNGKIHIKRLTLQSVVPMVEARRGNPVA